MPFSGLMSFLLEILRITGSDYAGVSMPFSGLMSFLPKLNSDLYILPSSVSMPFSGLMSFLHYWLAQNMGRSKKCQCPSAGLCHFYEVLEFRQIFLFVRVNALQRAYVISTVQDELGFHMICVNALQRAYVISTLPSGKPDKLRVPTIVFAGIFLNILKKAFFSLIFGSFTF